jgi:hypothetical protein
MKKRSVEGYEIGSDFISFFTNEGEVIVEFNKYQLDCISVEIQDYGYSPSLLNVISEVEYED